LRYAERFSAVREWRASAVVRFGEADHQQRDVVAELARQADVHHALDHLLGRHTRWECGHRALEEIGALLGVFPATSVNPSV
jgi:hypothetical protein